MGSQGESKFTAQAEARDSTKGRMPLPPVPHPPNLPTPTDKSYLWNSIKYLYNMKYYCIVCECVNIGDDGDLYLPNILEIRHVYIYL